MANEIQNKYRAAITAQDNKVSGVVTAIAANNFSTCDQTVINNTPAGNGGGCNELELYVNVTSGPTGAATAEVWMQASHDGGTTYSVEVFRGSVAIPGSGTGLFPVGVLSGIPEYAKFKLKALSYGFTAALITKPRLPEVQ